MAPPDSARGMDLLVTDNMIGNIGPVARIDLQYDNYTTTTGTVVR